MLNQIFIQRLLRFNFGCNHIVSMSVAKQFQHALLFYTKLRIFLFHSSSIEFIYVQADNFSQYLIRPIEIIRSEDPFDFGVYLTIHANTYTCVFN